MTKQPLLSICIPTYNREKSLQKLLDSIVSQKEFLNTNDVEIVIDDGPSKDMTHKLVETYQNKYKNKIRYYRNDKVVGMCPAFLEAISFSNGKYTRLFGSDDFMQEKALETVLNVINKHSPALILSNRFPFNDILECDLYKGGQDKQLYFNGFSDFGSYLGIKDKQKFDDKSNYFAFISLFCFNTEYYKQALTFVQDTVCPLDELKKNYFNFSLIVYSQLSSDKKICLIEEPRLVFCDVNYGRKHNKKIANDMKILISYLKKNYKLSFNCVSFLNKMYFTWFFVSGVLPYIKSALSKIGIEKYLSALRRKYILKNA